MILNIIFFQVFILNNFLISSYPALGSYEYNQAHNTYVVHMDSTKMKALDASLGPSRRWHEQIIESIGVSDQDGDDQRQFSPLPQVHYVYHNIMSGFSAKLSEKHLESLKKVDGFLSANRDELRTLHTTHSPQFLGLREGQGLWNTKNLASDVIIGLVDTGAWPEHPSFRDSGLPPVPSRWKGECQAGTNFTASNCNRKLIGAAAFYKGYESENGRINETIDYRSARDSRGHGTHTASTAGGNLVRGANIFGRAKGTAAGMRPTARIAVYKACYKPGCYDSDILAAMEQAVKDGVDVLSLSLGGVEAVLYYNDTIAIGAFGAIRNGVIVSTSAGNSGPDSSTVVNGAPWLMTVGGSTTDRNIVAQVRLGHDGKIFSGTSLFSGKLPKQLPLVYNETGFAKFCGNGSLSPNQVKGNFVICIRGVTARVAKGQVVKAAGGVGMILASDVDQGEDTVADLHVLPAVSLGASASSAVINYTKSSEKPTATIEFLGDVYDNPAPIMAGFSSRGPNLVDPNILKPDVTAPGVNILAAWPTNISPTHLENDKRRVLFNIMSGTSMACPHVSGLMALLKSLHTDWSPAAIKSALMTTAYIQDNQKSPISDAASFNNSKSATPFALGSGQVDPQSASDPGLIYDISTSDYLDYLCSLNYNPTQMALFAGKKITCPATSKFRPGDLNYPSFSVIFSRNYTATTYKRTVTNVGIAVSTYTVKVIEPEGISITVEPQALKFGEMGQKLCYKVIFKAKKCKGRPIHSFGSLEWVSGKYSVRSSIAVTRPI